MHVQLTADGFESEDSSVHAGTISELYQQDFDSIIRSLKGRDHIEHLHFTVLDHNDDSTLKTSSTEERYTLCDVIDTIIGIWDYCIDNSAEPYEKTHHFNEFISLTKYWPRIGMKNPWHQWQENDSYKGIYKSDNRDIPIITKMYPFESIYNNILSMGILSEFNPKSFTACEDELYAFLDHNVVLKIRGTEIVMEKQVYLEAKYDMSGPDFMDNINTAVDKARRMCSEYSSIIYIDKGE